MSAQVKSGDGTSAPALARRLGLFDATMLVMGGIIGSGIFMNPYVAAQQVHTPAMILGAWLLGGVAALIGAFVYAELASVLPDTGGQYAYLREAFHPLAGFLYGWTLLLVIQTGGMAAVAITFARYFLEITHLPFADWTIAAIALGILTIINCFGVRAGSTAQNLFMLLKILAIAALVIAGFAVIRADNLPATPVLDRPAGFSLFTAIGASMIPVLFAYGGWQTSGFVAGEIREPENNLSRGLLLGVGGVILLYVLVNFVCIGALGAGTLAGTSTPATAVMRLALGEGGARLIAVGIAVSTLGFLSQGILTAPRVYFAMADDRLFFRKFAWLHPKTRVPIFAILVQGLFAIVVAMSGRYEQILNYVVSTDFIFFGLTATTIFVFRRRLKNRPLPAGYRKTPLHPYSTILFIAICWLVVLDTIYMYPANTIIGLGIMIAGIPVFGYWRHAKKSVAG